MNLIPTKIDGVFNFYDTERNDLRGSFKRIFCKDEYKEALIERDIVQINHSTSVIKGSIRGMHYQLSPYAELKIIRCIRGKVFDVCVDLREHSETFLNWYGCELSASNKRSVIIPEGCAHGFQTLEDDCELIYFHTQIYSPEYERSFRYNDKLINIDWPIAPTFVSEKDINAIQLPSDFSGVSL
jgi:dTDP-4-dehydrorhamnose 3,5-epimerase